MAGFTGFGGGTSGGGGAGGDFDNISSLGSLNLSPGKIKTSNPDALPDSVSIVNNRVNSLNLPTQLVSTTPSVTFSGLPISDKRVRISPLPKSTSISFVNLLAPLAATNGVLFPYQPKIDISYSANYQSQKVAQSNFTFYNYEHSELKPITISCDFPVRNQLEGQYVIAAITYLRSLTMMFTGNDGQFAGSPPQLVSLIGMGFGGLDSIPVAITDVTTSYPDSVDFVSIQLPDPINEFTKVPTLLNISVSCQPMFSRTFASSFSTRNFALGAQRLLGPNYVQPSTTNSSSPVVENDVSATITNVDVATSQLSDTITSTPLNTIF